VAINNIEPSIFAFTGHPLDKAVGLQATLNHLDPTVGRWLDALTPAAPPACTLLGVRTSGGGAASDCEHPNALTPHALRKEMGVSASAFSSSSSLCLLNRIRG